MALKETGDFVEERQRAEARFGIAQDGKPTEEQLRAQRDIKHFIVEAGVEIEHAIVDGREKSLALTHLEEALMWAGKAIFKPREEG